MINNAVMEKKVNKTKTIESMLRDESYQLKRMEEETIRRLKTAPMGSLRIRKWNGVVEYYYRNVDADNVSERSNNGRYLKKSEEDLARRIAQRDEVYLEHFGMMDDSSYVEKVMYKLNTYERNGIYLGVNLFITHETGRNPLNTKVLDRLIRKLFCE